MKLLYITNAINGSGGLERVLAVKASYLANSFGYQVHILTLNNGDITPFYEFSPLITYHDIKVRGRNAFFHFLSYRNGIKKVLKKVNPSVISVCDDGLKGMLFPILFGKRTPVIYERHVSKQIAIKSKELSFMAKLRTKLKFTLMYLGGKQFHKFVVLTQGNTFEWGFNNLQVIPNPLPFNTANLATLTNKKVIVVGKQCYQKGFDRLLEIWKQVHTKHPDWELEVYGKLEPALGLEQKAMDLGISAKVHFYPPTRDISVKYQEASIYAMTSRFEGFGMVLIEAMAHGVPCISFNCPHGPSDIIKHKEDGLLIENGNVDAFVIALCGLIENEVMRKKMGVAAQESVQRYSAGPIVQQWDRLFQSLTS